MYTEHTEVFTEFEKYGYRFAMVDSSEQSNLSLVLEIPEDVEGRLSIGKDIFIKFDADSIFAKNGITGLMRCDMECSVGKIRYTSTIPTLVALNIGVLLRPEMETFILKLRIEELENRVVKDAIAIGNYDKKD